MAAARSKSAFGKKLAKRRTSGWNASGDGGIMINAKTNLIVFLVALFASVSTVRAAEEPKKLKSQTIKITTKWVPRAENALIVNLEMLQLPPGKITLKDKDGKEKEHDIK